MERMEVIHPANEGRDCLSFGCQEVESTAVEKLEDPRLRRLSGSESLSVNDEPMTPTQEPQGKRSAFLGVVMGYDPYGWKGCRSYESCGSGLKLRGDGARSIIYDIQTRVDGGIGDLRGR
jgi:hypothetical protein